MARKDRDGSSRKPRSSRKQRIPELGYYLIVTDTDATERLYFEGLKNCLDPKIKDQIVIDVKKSPTKDLVDRCQELLTADSHIRSPWIVFDRDQVQGFNQIIEEAQKKGINVGWSNPCFEIWMLAYYGKMPVIACGKEQESQKCCDMFAVEYKKRTKVDYSKNDDKIYQRLRATGNERKAIILAKQKMQEHYRNNSYVKPFDMDPGTTVYLLVDEISVKVEEYQRKIAEGGCDS